MQISSKPKLVQVITSQTESQVDPNFQGFIIYLWLGKTSSSQASYDTKKLLSIVKNVTRIKC